MQEQGTEMLQFYLVEDRQIQILQYMVILEPHK